LRFGIAVVLVVLVLLAWFGRANAVVAVVVLVVLAWFWACQRCCDGGGAGGAGGGVRVFLCRLGQETYCEIELACVFGLRWCWWCWCFWLFLCRLGQETYREIELGRVLGLRWCWWFGRANGVVVLVVLVFASVGLRVWVPVALAVLVVALITRVGLRVWVPVALAVLVVALIFQVFRPNLCGRALSFFGVSLYLFGR
jgi:hypothetical protein